MNATIPLTRRGLAVWLSAFLSPTVYFLLLMLVDTFQVVPSPPEILVASLFYLIPPIAVLVCGYAVWMSNMTLARKVGWILFTPVGMLLQLGILLAVLIAANG